MQDPKVNIKSTDFTPRHDAILVVYDEPTKEVKTDLGIVVELQRSSLERQTSGEVVQVGEEIDWIKPGDLAIWAMTDGINLELLDGKFLVLREHSLLGIKKA